MRIHPRVRRFLRARLDEALDAVFPPLCRVCGAVALPGAFGGACARHALPTDEERAAVARCGRCASRLAEALPAGVLCAACRRRRPRFRRVVTLGDYGADAGLREWILALKHGRRRDLARPLGRALAAALAARAEAAPAETVLVPVPLHPLRRLERGYDQARLLAQHAAEALGATCAPLLRRIRWTPPQGALGARSRTANVRAAFARRRRDAGELRGRVVWLVDDVVTSGATAEACARVLAGAGARAVSVLCLARAAGRVDADGAGGGS